MERITINDKSKFQIIPAKWLVIIFYSLECQFFGSGIQAVVKGGSMVRSGALSTVRSGSIADPHMVRLMDVDLRRSKLR